MFLTIVRSQFAFILLSAAFILSCAAQQTEEQALASLRQMTSSGKLPPEVFVADLDKRFAGKRTGALARLLLARIRLDQGDAAGAAKLLDSDIFAKQTKLADHALWLRGKALVAAGDHTGAMATLDRLIREHGDSIRARDAKLMWAESAIASGRAVEVPPRLIELTEKDDGDALIATAKAYEAQSSRAEAIKYLRRAYFFAAGTSAAKEAETKLTSLGEALTPQNADEQLARADRLLEVKSYSDAASAYSALSSAYPAAMTSLVKVRHLTAFTSQGKMPEAQAIFGAIPVASKEREQAYHLMTQGYAKARQWPAVRSTITGMRTEFPSSTLAVKAMTDAGLAARDAKMRLEETFHLNSAFAAFPDALDIAQVQFEAAWTQHEQGNFAVSSQMFIDHLAKYADKDNTNRGKAGYWAARDSERAGKTAEACSLYDATAYRYGSNWYGYLANGRLSTLKNNGSCRTTAPPNDTVAKAAANLKKVTVAAETAGEKELQRAAKSDELSIIGLFDWAMDELNEAKKTAGNSPKINLALARHHRWKGDNVNALIVMMKSYPDYAQMFPEEMDRETWGFFYPLVNWNEIKYWAGQRRLDPYQVAGLIRQESVFNPSARSPANAHGLMQLLVPTAQSMARKYVAKTASVNATALYQPPLNIELGTAYMREQLDKFGRIEYMAVAYNAGPGRVPQWRAKLPAEMDDFVENIPFKETKGYVQGVIRNTAQYRRLYDENGNFKPNVGTRPLRGEIDSKPREQVTAENPELVIEDKVGE